MSQEAINHTTLTKVTEEVVVLCTFFYNPISEFTNMLCGSRSLNLICQISFLTYSNYVALEIEYN
jgi:hypothetical protein